MKVQPPPGMRDFYPEQMRLQNWLFGQWRSTAEAFGFSEYDGPIFEYLDLYTLKSGDEIVAQLFNFEDRGGRRFAIRPEMTPTLARMVAARANALPRPIKWFSIPRMCRAEKPQRGRLREFYQWNVDVLGVDDVLADAETIAVAVEFLRRVGLGKDDVVVRVSSRHLSRDLLTFLAVRPEDFDRAYALIDRRDRLAPDDFAKQWDAALGYAVSAAMLTDALEAVGGAAGWTVVANWADESTRAEIHELFEHLTALNVADYCELDMGVVRGLAYYTGVVFEAHARTPGLRALLGGGRYDNLTEMLDGPKVPGVGFGMGDAPMIELLRELGKLPELSDTLDVFVIDADATLFAKAQEVATRLRRKGLRVDFSYKRQNVGKQFKQAAARGARFAVVVGGELAERGELTVKDLGRGTQQAVSAETFLKDPTAVIAVA